MLLFYFIVLFSFYACKKDTNTQRDLSSIPFRLSSFQKLWSVDTVFVTLSLTINKAFKRLSSLSILMQPYCHSGGDSVAFGTVSLVSLFPQLMGQCSVT